MLNLYELAKVIGERVVVDVGSDGFRVQFFDCEVKDNKNSTVIGSCWGIGPTIEIAANAYFRKISGRWLVFDSFGKRREYSAEIHQNKKAEQLSNPAMSCLTEWLYSHQDDIAENINDFGDLKMLLAEIRKGFI